MTVMSMFNNCRVFREDMPDKDVEEAAVDFTNMVSPRISEDIIRHISLLHISNPGFNFRFKLPVKYLGLASCSQSRKVYAVRVAWVGATVSAGFPLPLSAFPWLFNYRHLRLCVTRGSWTLILGYPMGYRMTRFVTCRWNPSKDASQDSPCI